MPKYYVYDPQTDTWSDGVPLPDQVGGFAAGTIADCIYVVSGLPSSEKNNVHELCLSYNAQIQQPINPDGTSVFSVRRGVVPVKFTLTQAGVCCDMRVAAGNYRSDSNGWGNHRSHRRVRLQRLRRHRLKLQN